MGTDRSDVAARRARELARMDVVAEQVEAGVGRVVVLRGPPGAGKAALTDAFAASLEGRFTVVPVAVGGDPRAAEGFRDERDRDHARAIRDLRARATERPVLIALDVAGEDAVAFLDHLLFETSFEPAPILAVAAVSDDVDARVTAALARTDRLEDRSRVTLRVDALEGGAPAPTDPPREAGGAVSRARDALDGARHRGAWVDVPAALLDLGLALRDAGDLPAARGRVAAAVRAGRAAGTEDVALQAQFHLVLLDLMEGLPDGTVETMAHLAQRAAGGPFRLVQQAEKPFAAWASASRGRWDRARALLHDAGDLDALPSVASVGWTAEGIGAHLRRAVAAGRSDLRPDAERVWRWALEVWTRCGRLDRADRARAALHELRSA